MNLRNRRLLEKIAPGGVDFVEIRRASFIEKLTLGASDKVLKEVARLLETDRYDAVFVSQSLLGRVVRFVKKRFPRTRVITFCHNIELQYAKEYVKTRGWRALPFFFTVKYWERQAFRYSDDIVTLNGRDSRLLKDIYRRSAAAELPTSFEDLFDETKARAVSETQEPIDYLFIGVAFFANVHGIQWFIDNVMPHVSGHLYIVGKGMDEQAFGNVSDRVHIYGFVNDLSEYYYRARLVVSPIFVGGGMKTKTAEALMYGKAIVGTKEAFEGYETDSACMTECNTADQFIRTLKMLSGESKRYCPESRTLFRRNYSDGTALATLSTLFEKTL